MNQLIADVKDGEVFGLPNMRPDGDIRLHIGSIGIELDLYIDRQTAEKVVFHLNAALSTEEGTS